MLLKDFNLIYIIDIEIKIINYKESVTKVNINVTRYLPIANDLEVQFTSLMFFFPSFIHRLYHLFPR